jgi:hypothetical protein
MAIELTTANKTTRANLLAALNKDITGIPAIDGIPVDGIVVYLDEALEGDNLPALSGEEFTKTYELGRVVNSAYAVMQPNQTWSLITQTPSIFASKFYVASLSFPTLSSESFNGNNVETNMSYLNAQLPSMLYISSNYLQTKRLCGTGQFEKDPYTDQKPTEKIFQTYSEIGNFLVGYYGGPYGGSGSFLPTKRFKNGNNDRANSSLIAAYFSGTTLVLKGKTHEDNTIATDGPKMMRTAILILPN